MRTTSVIFVILITIKFVHSGFLINYEAIKKYAKTPRNQRQNLENERIWEAKYDRVFNLYTEKYSFKLCLFEDKNVVSDTLLKNEILKSIKIYKGIVCSEPTEIVIGAIINSIFHGSIYKNNSKIYYFEDIRKYLKDIDCSECHTIAYSSDDIDNSVLSSYNLSCGNEKKHNFDFDGISRITYRQIYDRKQQSTAKTYSKKYCALAIYIHPSYLSNYVSSASAVGEIASHIVILNQALTKQISINGDPFILYQINLVSMVDQNSIYEDSVGDPSKLLPKVSETSNKKGHCSAGFYVSKNWDGVLGLAYVGNSQGSGICGRSAAYVITQKVKEDIMPSAVHRVTTVHEIGHNLGSAHDPTDGCNPPNCFNISRKAECSPAGNFFLMSTFSTSGRESNNLIYSPCSVEAINAIVTSPERRTCLTETVPNLCGNGIVEPGEECDSGFSEDKCCGSSSSSNPCKIIQGNCSPSQGSCCDDYNCLYKPENSTCGDMSDCLIPSKCNGISAICPSQIFKQDGTHCNNDGALCAKGACTGSICKEFSKEECKCLGENSCLVCCMETVNKVTGCSPHKFSNKETKTLPIGTTCINGTTNGICTKSSQCTGTNTISPIFDLLKLLLTGDILTLLASLFTTYIEFFIIGISGFYLIFANLARLFNVDGTKKVKNYQKAIELVQNPVLFHDLEKKLEERNLKNVDKNDEVHKTILKSSFLNLEEIRLNNSYMPSAIPYENNPPLPESNNQNIKTDISLQDKNIPPQYIPAVEQQNAKNPTNKSSSGSFSGLLNNRTPKNEMKQNIRTSSFVPVNSKIKKSSIHDSDESNNKNRKIAASRSLDFF